MKWQWLWLFLAWNSGASALTLEQYLDQVKSRSPDAVSAQEAVRASQLALERDSVFYTPELFTEYFKIDDKRDTVQPSFMGARTESNLWNLGVRQKTLFGLSGKVYYQRSHTEIGQAPALPVPNYVDSAIGVEVTQSLWRNGFGTQSRNEHRAANSASRIELLRDKFRLKNILLDAENVYWSLASLNEIVKLQQENVARAIQLRDRMRRQANVRLFDDVDVLQTQAALETRELELQTSRDERAALMRRFNTLRGVDSEKVEELDTLPEQIKLNKNLLALKLSREDLRILAEEAEAKVATARASRSKLNPQLDLVATYTSNGKDARSETSFDEMQDFSKPHWKVGVQFSVPLDIFLVLDLKRGLKNLERSAIKQKEYSQFHAERVWQDLNKQLEEFAGRYEKARNLEKVQTQLVKRQQARLRTGRSTTFEVINFEQNLASTQIQRLRAQLALVQAQNALKTFEETK